MRKIKWENISVFVMVVLGIISMIHHINLNGWYFNLILELVIYSMFAFGAYYIVRDIRKNPSNWTF